MSRRGRPRNSQPSVRIVLSGWLHPEYDADILAWLQAIPKGQRMSTLKTALRSGGLGREQNAQAGQKAEIQSAAEDILKNWDF